MKDVSRIVITAGIMYLVLLWAGKAWSAEGNMITDERQINIEKLVDAIYIAEGGSRAKKPFGILSVPCEGYADCRSVCRNTVRNNIGRWKRSGMGEDFIAFLGGRFCPRSLHPLNRNWVGNVRAIYFGRK